MGAIRPLRCSVEPADRPRNARTFTARLSAVTSRFRLGDQLSNSLPKRVDHARGIRHRLTMTDRPGNAAIPLARTGRQAVRAFGCLRSTKTGRRQPRPPGHPARRKTAPRPALVMSRAPGRKHVAALVCAAGASSTSAVRALAPRRPGHARDPRIPGSRQSLRGAVWPIESGSRRRDRIGALQVIQEPTCVPIGLPWSPNLDDGRARERDELVRAPTGAI